MTQNTHIQTSALFGIDTLLKELGADPTSWLKQFEVNLEEMGKSHHTKADAEQGNSIRGEGFGVHVYLLGSGGRLC